VAGSSTLCEEHAWKQKRFNQATHVTKWEEDGNGPRRHVMRKITAGIDGHAQARCGDSDGQKSMAFVHPHSCLILE